MKVAICSQGPDLAAAVDSRFGRCAYLVLADPETERFEAVTNPGGNAARGAGVQTAQLLVARKVEAVLAGQVGSNALAVLDAGGIKVYCGIKGTVAGTLERYRRGELTRVTGPAVGPGFGGRGGN